MSSVIGSMQIVCPNCTTSYAVNPASFGEAGRQVRCARCKETWLARPETAPAPEPREPAMAASQNEPDEDLSAWGIAEENIPADPVPVVDSPSISADLPAEPSFKAMVQNPIGGVVEDADWTVMAQQDPAPLREPRPRKARRGPGWMSFLPRHALPIATATMAATAMALLIWRVDIVRLMPQTAAFYQAFGINVNVRGLAFRDVKVTTETADGKPVMLIEGMIVSETLVPTAMPRLRFVVRDDKGTEIYAWSAVLEQPGLNPGDKTWFRSRLASPPAEGRSLDVRFFNKRDVAGT